MENRIIIEVEDIDNLGKTRPRIDLLFIAELVNEVDFSGHSSLALTRGAAARVHGMIEKWLGSNPDDLQVAVTLDDQPSITEPFGLTEPEINKLWDAHRVTAIPESALGSPMMTYERFKKAVQSIKVNPTTLRVDQDQSEILQPGDVVRLNSGGPSMVISHIDTRSAKGPMASCYWFVDEGMCYDGCFHVDALQIVPKVSEAREMVEQAPVAAKTFDGRSWSRFQDVGLLFLVNQFLHAFGYAIVVTDYNGDIVNVQAERVQYRGFPEDVQAKGYKRVAGYMSRNGLSILKDLTKD